MIRIFEVIAFCILVIGAIAFVISDIVKSVNKKPNSY